MTTKAFSPSFGSNQLATLAAGVEQHFAIDRTAGSLRVINTGGANPLYFRTYNSGSTARPIAAPATLASAADCRVDPGKSLLINFDNSHDGISLISAAGTTVEFMTGIGGVVG